MGAREVIIKNCFQCPFLHGGYEQNKDAYYCYLDTKIDLTAYREKSDGTHKYGFHDKCPLFEFDEVVVKRVRLRLLGTDDAKWEIKENVQCVDCGKVSRGYRLVYAKGYDRLHQDNPEFRCEECSIVKSEELKKRGLKI